MENSAVKIMKNISKYESMRKEAVSYADPGCYNAAYCHGWLAGVRAAVDAVLDDPNIRTQVHYEIERRYRIQDAMDHMYSYFHNDDDGDWNAQESAFHTAVNNGDAEIIADRFLDNHDCNLDENTQCEIIISDYYRSLGA